MLARCGLKYTALLLICEHVELGGLSLFVEGARVCMVKEHGVFIPL